jgi:hypothetical protein
MSNRNQCAAGVLMDSANMAATRTECSRDL